MKSRLNDPTITLKEFFPREKVVECPHSMAVLAYLAETHRLNFTTRKRGGLRYHYTDATGLLGMVTTNRLWATNVGFLNDPSEGKVLPNAILRLMEEKPGGLSELEDRVVKYIRAGLNERSPGSPYSVSFCANGDLLSQWRGYGSFGFGYAIGFDLKDCPHFQVGRVVEVRYDVDGLGEVALDLLSIYCEAAERWNSVLDDICAEAAEALYSLSLAYKDSTYAEECETRILVGARRRDDTILKQEAPLRFRSRGADIVPYVDLSLTLLDEDKAKPPPLPIRRIVTGPAVDYARNKVVLQELLSEHGYPEEIIEIVPSMVPFRT